ncbi:MAG TPA: succinylglutamate desuccinylase/aspartoacylase family protein [bacterium]|nr:succinylglutamate desuccinylase/aspartoacylase family protein [bacterium]
MQIAGTSIAPGTTVKARVPIGQTPDGADFGMPIQVARGKKDGPVLWVNAAIHGDELEGTAALWEVFQQVDAQALTGTLVGVMITNVSAFYAMQRTSPVDNLDVNRVFPGDPARSHTMQLAYHYKKLVEAHATHYIDLHGGGNSHDVVYYTIYRDGPTPAAKVSREMALASGCDITWHSKDRWLDNGLFSLLTAQGIPSMIVEVGGEGRLKRKNIDDNVKSILNVMKYLGMVPGDAPLREPRVSVGAADFFFSGAGGIWTSGRTVGDVLSAGELVGVIKDCYGAVREEVRCNAKKGILLALRTYAAAPSGSILGIVGVIDG